MGINFFKKDLKRYIHVYFCARELLKRAGKNIYSFIYMKIVLLFGYGGLGAERGPQDRRPQRPDVTRLSHNIGNRLRDVVRYRSVSPSSFF